MRRVPRAGLLKAVIGPPEDDEWEAATITVDWEAPTAVELVPTALHLMEQFDKQVIGHSHAKEALVAALRMHITRSDGRPPRVLLMGPHGVGKTTLAEALLDVTDLPSVRMDFGEIATNGETDIARRLSPLAPHSSSYLPYGILFLDGLENLARPPRGSLPTFDVHAVQVELLRAIDGLEAKNGGPGFRYDQLLTCGAVTVEEPLKHTASQQELRAVLSSSSQLLPELAARFDILVPVGRLTAAQMAKSFLLARSPFSRARRVIYSLGGTFHCDPDAVEALARTCAVSPVGGWAATRVIDKLLEQVLRSADPAKPWRLRDPQT